MKKLYFISLAALALAMTGCKDTTDGGVMQINPQLPEYDPATFSVINLNPVVDRSWILLEDYIKEGVATPIKATTYTTGEALPEGAVVSMEMQVAKNEDFSGALTLPLTMSADSTTYSVDPKAWDNAFRSLCGKAPNPQINYVRYAAYINIGSQRSRIGGVDGWFNPVMVKITPIDLGIVIEEKYYLVGTACDWDLAKAIPFSHSDKNVYDDPVFTLAIDVTNEQAEGGWWWKIVPASAFDAQSWDGLFGTETDGDTATSGVLYENGQAGCLKTAGQQLFTIDMLAQTYSISNAVPALWTPGNSNGWNPANSGTLATTDYTVYNGFLHLNGEWLMTPAPNWDNKYTLGAGPGTLLYNGSANLPCPAEGNGLYWVVANLGNLTYTTTPVTTVGLIGDFNSWGGDVEMIPSDDFLTWTGTVTLEEGQGWKFRMNNGWDINLGGALDDLTPGGDNLSAPAAGTYEVKLSLATHPYTATLTAK